MDKERKFLLLIIFCIFLIFVLISWYVSEPARGSRMMRYMLFDVDDSFRYCFAKTAIFSPLVFLNPYAKPLSMFVSRFFVSTESTFSLRILNSLLSIGILFLLFNLVKSFSPERRVSFLAVFITFLSPLYFIASVSTLSEMLFSFILLFALYLFYLNKYLASALFISTLPLVRQEGIIYILIWLFCLPKTLGRIRYFLILIVPTLIYSVVSRLILGHKLIYPLIYSVINSSPGKAPDDYTVPADIFVKLIFVFFVQTPLFLGWFVRFSKKYNKKLFLVSLCIFGQGLVLLIQHAGVFITTGRYYSNFRLFIPAIPLLSFYAALVLNRLIDRLTQISNKRNSIAFSLILFLSAILLLNFFVQAATLRKLSEEFIDVFSENQELKIKEAATWLNSYLVANNIKNIYVPAWRTTHHSVRRLWMYLSGGINYYYFIDERMIFDMVTNRQQNNHLPKGVLVLVDSEEKDLKGRNITDLFKNENLKSYGSVNLFFYLVN